MKIKPTIITGLQRSGTTWTGRMLAHSEQFFVIPEPFNILREDLNYLGLEQQFLYINKNNQEKYIENLRPILGLSFSKKDLFDLLKRTKKIKAYPYNIWRYFNTNSNLNKGKVPLIKDPTAFMSVEWLAKIYDINVVVLIRHPAAYIYSMKRMKWGFNFAWFAEQDELMENYLKDFEAPIKKFAKEKFIPFSIASQILLWNIQNKLILKFQKEHPDWHFYRHEDLSIYPEKYFKKLYHELGLNYSEEINAKIKSYTLESNKSEAKKGKQFDFIRNSKAVTRLWKKHLTEKEIKEIYNGTLEISSKFYDKSFW